MRKAVPLIAVVSVVAGALVGTGVAFILDEDSETSNGHRVESIGLGVSIELPKGWAVDERSPLDDLNTTELEVNFGPPPDGGDCPANPTRIQMRILETRVPPGSVFGPRPDRFGAESNGGPRSFDEYECGERGQGLQFTEHGRYLSVGITFDRDASERRLAEAYAIANSLRVGVFPWGEFCAVLDRLNEVEVIDDATLRLVDELAAASPTPENAKDVRTAHTILAGNEAPVGEARTAIDSVLRTTQDRCGVFTAVFTEPIVPGAIAIYRENVRNGEWPGRAEIDLDTGSVTAPGFNDYVAENQPVWAKGVARASVEMLHLAQSGGGGTQVAAVPDSPNRSLVVVTPIGAADESVAAVEYRLVFELGSDGFVRFVSGTWAQRCQPNRGHQDFSIELCV